MISSWWGSFCPVVLASSSFRAINKVKTCSQFASFGNCAYHAMSINLFFPQPPHNTLLFFICFSNCCLCCLVLQWLQFRCGRWGLRSQRREREKRPKNTRWHSWQDLSKSLDQPQYLKCDSIHPFSIVIVLRSVWGLELLGWLWARGRGSLG